MQRTMNPMPKHPTYAHRPTPTLQLLSKLSKFQGERKDIVNKAPQEILFTTDTSDSPINHQSNDLLRQYQERGEERKIVSSPHQISYLVTKLQQQQVQKEYVAYFDPNFKPEDPTTTAEQKSHRYKYNSHMNSSVGKLFQNNDQRENPDDNAVEEQKFQSKRMGTQKVSNFNNTIIGGQPPEEQWQTTQHLMNNGEDPLNAKRNNRKKIVQKFEPELFVSPITGEPIAEYGTWKDDIQNQSRVKPNQEKDNEEDLMLDDPILQKLKSQLSLRGAKGIIGLGRIFRIMDDDGSNTLSFQEFKKAMKEFGMSLSDTETILLFKKFDKQNTGAITYNNFLTTIAGALNKRRTRLVNMAFEIMDQDGNGYLELSDLAGRYNGKRHPDVISGKKTEDQVLLEFLDTFTVGQNDDQKVTKQEFQNYYAAISASIDRDDYFELMIRNAWHISGGEGEAENSSNRRVLVTKSDGTQDVVEIKNDLGLDIKDTKEVLKRLKQQGVDAIKVSTANDASDPMSNPKGKLSRNKPAGKFGFSAPRGDKADPTLNPSIAPSPGVKLLIDRVKKALKGRGVNSYFELQRRFKIMDDDNSGNISYQEFKKAIKEIQSLHDLSDNDIRSMFAYFDSDGSGFIDFNEFIVGIRDPMNEKRLFLVKKAYNRLDKDGNGTIDIQDVINVYDTSKHPEVIAKRKTKNQVLTEFLANFEVGGTVDGKVTTDEFINYYNNISASIDNDNYFELMICNAWHITATEDETGKKSKTNNSANLRVMVTNSQGIEEVITLDNDLGINNTNKNDIKLLYSRLREQGVDDIYAINGKIIKVINVNGVEIITTIGDTSLLNKEDANVNYNPKANAPNVLKAPPVRRPQSASAVVSAQNRRPVAGVPELNVNKVQPTVKASSSNIPVNSRDLSNNILAGLNKRKEVNQKIQEENIAGNTLLGVLRVQLLTKGVNGIVDLQRKFQEFDSNHNAIIDLMEFRMIFQSLQLAFSEDQVETLFHYLDKDGSEGIDYYELLEGLRGPINPKILMLVHQIFDRLDQGNRNAITPDVLLQNYRASRHPEVMTGNLAEEDVMQEFLNTFDVGTVQAGIITRDEFVRYYHNVYMVINDDDYMELILRRVWNFNDGDDIEDLVTPRSASSKAAGRIRNAKDFAHEYWGDVSNTPVRRPSTGSGVRNTNNFPQKNSNEMIYIQGNNQFTNVPSVGDQSLPPSRPKTASQAKGGRTYQIMGGNGTGRNVSSSSQAYSNQTVTPQMIEEKANAIRRDAILEFNAGNFKDALEYFKLVLQLLQSIYPANHPECVKAEKSILLTQRKIQQTR